MAERDESDDPVDRDFSRYEGYWHGFTFIISDSENPDDQWIRSTRWHPVSLGEPETEEDPD